MTKLKIALFLVAVGILGALSFRFFDQPAQAPSQDEVPFNGPVATTHPDIRVTSPKPNSVVNSPVRITGEARGFWYFEASFPVELLDADGQRLAIEPVQAQGEWMTEEFVPFDMTLDFTPTTPTGVLILHKDNPSGLPEHDASVQIPVQFE
ncbi:MAG TPA: Gmad2 immunoglobulin-like domain-containing protein [Candidatus Saccharimonadales bacterium]